MNRSSSPPPTPFYAVSLYGLSSGEVRSSSLYKCDMSCLALPNSNSSNKSRRSRMWMNLYVASHDWNANNLKEEVSQRTWDWARDARTILLCRWHSRRTCPIPCHSEEEEYNLNFEFLFATVCVWCRNATATLRFDFQPPPLNTQPPLVLSWHRFRVLKRFPRWDVFQ